MSTLYTPNRGRPDSFSYQILLRKDGQEYSLLRMASQISLYESIFTKSMQMELLLADGLGFIELIGVQVGDELEVTVLKDDEEKKIVKTFYIFELAEATVTQAASGRVWRILGLTEPAMKNKRRKISRAFKGTADEILKKVTKDFLDIPEDQVSVDPASGDVTIIFPNMQPFDCIDMLGRRAVSAENTFDDSAYFFYENADGFVFKSLRKMTADANTHVYRFEPTRNRTDDEADFFRIGKIRQMRASSFAAAVDEGIFDSETLQFNVKNRTLEKSKFRYDDKFQEVHLLGEFPVTDLENQFDQWIAEDSRYINKSSHIMIRSDEAAYGQNNFIGRKYGPTKAQLELFNQRMYVATIIGNPMLRAGDIINIEAPELSGKQGRGQDFWYDGRFIVGSVKHDIVDADSFTTIVDLYKDGYEVEYKRKDFE